jgi:hypothetical protein
MELDLNFNLDFGDIENIEADLDFNFSFESDNINRIIEPPKPTYVHPKNCKFQNAEEFAASLEFKKGMRYHAIVSGNFIYGDFLEAIFHARPDITAKRMVISTLSYSDANVDSLSILLETGAVQNLDLIVSAYFYAHYRNTTIKYTYQRLDSEKNNFQLAVAANHTKVCIFETINGSKVVIHGSANLRSALCAEQVCIEESPELYDFYEPFFDEILQTYATIKKPVRYKRLNEIIKK